MQERASESANVSSGTHGFTPFVRSEGYMKLLSFVVSNARRGEIMAVDNYSEMVQLMPDTDTKIETVHQANEECKHILLLEKLASHLGFAIDDSMVEPQWNNVRQHFHDAARKKNLAGCLIIQDLMVESLAIGLYKLFSSASNGDFETNRIASNLLKDELEHLDIGVRRIKALMAQDSEGVHDSLVWAHHRVMPNLFEMVYQSCDFLCHTQNLDCDVVDKGNVAIDLNALKVASLEHYVDMLYQAGFDLDVTNQLIASMTSYEVRGRASIGLGDCLKDFLSSKPSGNA
ncbi:MAG TPA: long-chain fatty aldehyde decarbonylase [Thermoanaerobaculia bacterium]